MIGRALIFLLLGTAPGAQVKRTGGPASKAQLQAIVQKQFGLGDDWEQCVHIPPSFPSLHLVGKFAHDRGCIYLGYVFDGQAVKGLNRASPVIGRAFANKDPKAREQAALSWATEVLFSDGALDAAPEEFKRPDAPRFAPPSAKTEGGEVQVQLWARQPSGMTPLLRYTHFEVTFGREGDVQAQNVNDVFSVSLGE
jgi:hypothetical protein